MLLERLRNETALQHRALEQLAGLPGSRDRYVRRLKCFYGYVEPWEQMAFAVWESCSSLAYARGKTERLRLDLERLGESAVCIASLPRCRDLPDLADLAIALGSLYVWEGSMLGARLISRHLQHVLGIGPQTGGAFFAGYGAETELRWREFKQLLPRLCPAGEEERVVAGASSTFATLREWVALQEVEPAHGAA